jgi:hypothetical protein
MRLLFLALVFANLAFFAYARFAGESAAKDPASQLEVSPEKIKVLKASGKSAPDLPGEPRQPRARPAEPRRRPRLRASSGASSPARP